MKIALLDLGTNTFHLLIAEVAADKSFQVLYKSSRVVKLGAGSDNLNIIGEAPFKRGIRVLQAYKKIISKYRVKKVHAFATSGIRSAKNGKKFVDEVKRQTGIAVRIIDGLEEARLIYQGVKRCVDLGEKPCLIMDIGGGSTEFIIADRHKIHWKASFNIGAARLLEGFHPSNPINTREIKRVESFLIKELNSLWSALRRFPVSKIVGSSGSFESFAAMICSKYHKRLLTRGVSPYEFRLEDFFKLHDLLLSSTVKQRQRMKGLISMRVDMIVLASLCTRVVIKKSKVTQMVLSKFALKEGALYSFIGKK